MSAKNRDEHGRWRNVTIAFRVSQEENRSINEAVALSGTTKQDYITHKLLNRDVIVTRNPRVYKQLKNHFEQIYAELLRIHDASECSDDFLETIKYITKIWSDMRGDNNNE